MTDTGQVPGEGLPESAGTVEQPGVATPGSYTYLSEPTAEEDDLLLLPGAQGAWGNEVPSGQEGAYPEGAYPDGGHPEGVYPEQHAHAGQQGTPAEHQAAYAGQVYAEQTYAEQRTVQQEAAGQAPLGTQEPGMAAHGVQEQGMNEQGPHGQGPHEQGTRGQGPHEQGFHGQAQDARAETSHVTGVHDSGSYDLGAAVQASAQAAAPRRPLHLGPPTPDASMSPVRSLADRGPATVVRQLGQQAPAAEYPEAQGAGATTQHPTPWGGVPTGQAAAQGYPEQAAQQHSGDAYATAQDAYGADASLGAGTAYAAQAEGTGQYPAAAHQQAYPGQEAVGHDTYGGQQAFAVQQDAHIGRQDTYAGQEAAQPQTFPNDTLSGQGTLGGRHGIAVHDPAVVQQAAAQQAALQQTTAHGADATGQFALAEQPLGEFVPVAGTVPAPPHLAPAPGYPAADGGEAWPAQTPAPQTAEHVGHDARVATGEQSAEHVAERAAVEQAAAEQAAAEQAAAEQAVAEQGVAEQALTEQAPAGRPGTEQAVAGQAVGEIPTEPAEQPVPAPGAAAASAPAERPEQPHAPEGPVAVVPAPREGESLPAEPAVARPEAAEAADVEEPQPQASLPEAPQDEAAQDEARAADTVPAQAAPVDEPVPAETETEAAAEAQAQAEVVAETAGEGEERPEVVAGTEQEPAAEDAFQPAAPGYAEAEREAVLRVMRERRDVRQGFRTDPIPHEVLRRVLEAAHHAPSVGHSQPWDFVVIRSEETRQQMHELAVRQREAYAKSLPKGRAKQFKQMKIEAILDTPVNIVVTADPTRGGRHTLGRHTQPQMAPYSAALAVENLWLAARAEGLGVGWVSFFDEREMVRALGLPEYLEVVAYLCVGYVDEFPDEPELVQAGWSKRRPLSWAVHEETYGRRALPGEQPHDLLAETIAGIRPLDAKALGEAWERQKRMTKPAGALGMLEIISAQLCGLSRQCPPPIPEPAAVAVFAGDHGVHAQGVTPWPQEVTGQMVANMLGGGAVSNAFATQVGAELCVVDVGVAADLPTQQGFLPRKVRPGTADMTQGPAMTREEAKAAIEVGIETARDLVAAGNKALLTGEMGIANTTASAALISVYTGTDPAEVTGRGTGIDDETLSRKTEVVRRALELHQPDPADPIGVLAAIGGLEHAAMVGLLLGGACLRTPVILDGVSAGAAALVARAIAPEVLAACIAGHRSAEPGHIAALNKLGLRPLVDLDLRLGEGTGALLALPLVQSTARAMHEVATFDSAGVTEK
ncbi:nicotinate-nucleotide--dimethylbenzimidazole phosphoribosyltransferase [Streptomyces abyssomicinicus]|uniref:nicotinate-nucleotide--dimethylbenzimidazole phosphoribosyltransferase n=1 Tax=Streptomyces abyssomicinicus TaxID=574929 RepID=UPI00124FC4A4|nr:nicotinate-nucleotide--dimethylbenzimidazole phosphoribosyltransferase [Streptomyces abyssomicinicus]